MTDKELVPAAPPHSGTVPLLTRSVLDRAYPEGKIPLLAHVAHLQSGTKVTYADGVMTIACNRHECDHIVMQVLVAP